jgi:hypothetical protein
MPVFERDFHHEEIKKKRQKDIDLQLALHDKKRK